MKETWCLFEIIPSSYRFLYMIIRFCYKAVELQRLKGHIMETPRRFPQSRLLLCPYLALPLPLPCPNHHQWPSTGPGQSVHLNTSAWSSPLAWLLTQNHLHSLRKHVGSFHLLPPPYPLQHLQRHSPTLHPPNCPNYCHHLLPSTCPCPFALPLSLSLSPLHLAQLSHHLPPQTHLVWPHQWQAPKSPCWSHLNILLLALANPTRGNS